MSVVLKRPAPIIRPAQGDIYSNVAIPFVGAIISSTDGAPEGIDGEIIVYEYVVVLSQECDLDQDYKERSTKADDQDKHLQALLCAPAYLAVQLRTGTHLEKINLQMQKINSERWKNIKSNKNERYHYITGSPAINVPELVIDFKHMYTLARSYFYDNILPEKYVASLAYISRESLSQRFCNYLSRIGLPDEQSEVEAHFAAIQGNLSLPAPH
ncbi:MAG: hypothetical protein Q7I98_02110 [Erysipelotrichaceae bacterium]|nr:hypothetical protein [Erysipelotrichaceae bacterium]